MRSKLITPVIIIVAIILAGVYPFAYYSTGDSVVATVTDKERIVESNGEDTSSKYLVFTDQEVFENTDLLLKGKFNSTDLQGQLRVGETYELKVYGWRIPFFSTYRNIASAKAVE